MKFNQIVAFLVLFQSIILTAQQPMVAYRKEGTWHYFDTKGKYMWQPYADLASDPGGWNNGLLKASVMEITGKTADDIGVSRMQVLYNVKGEIIFRPKVKSYCRIISNKDKAGYFPLKNNENDHIILCDKEGNVVFDSPNSTGQYLGDGVICYLKTEEESEVEGDKNYILFDVKTKKEIAQIKCSYLSGNFENGAILCNSKEDLCGMINRQGQLIQPMIWRNDITFEHATDFFLLTKPQTNNIVLLNKNGVVLLEGMSEVVTLNKYYFECQYNIENELLYHSYIINGHEVDELKDFGGDIACSSANGILACKDAEEVHLIDSKSKKIATIKGIKEVQIVHNTFWMLTEKENIHDCYDEKGKKIGTIEAESLGNPTYGHVPFLLNGKWGLAQENGKVVIPPTFEFKKDDIPEVNNGYWMINVPLTDDKHRFDFYNFQGKLVMTTTSEKDGWDYIVGQEEVTTYRNF
jgi:hypothetical protein